jgi:putative hydrolase of the HAD superfamily
MNTKIRAVLWDFGGVILTSPFDAFNRFEAERGLPHGFIRMVNSTNHLDNAWAKFERSHVTAEEFDALFAEESEALGHRIQGSEILPLLAGDVRPEMVAALDALKPRYTIACLTNNVASGEGPSMARSPEKAAAVAEVMQRFDEVFESSKLGVRKPEPQFYELVCKQLGIQPEEAVFLDDIGGNLKPARAMGMTTILVAEPAQALAELEQALGHPLH